MALPFIGSTITLISKAEIKYSGLLAEIDQQNATVTLKDVKSFGTEGRRPGYDVLPSELVYEFIVFRGSDIKDLQVTGVSQQPAPPAPKPVPNNDPAIVSAASQRQERPAAAAPARVDNRNGSPSNSRGGYNNGGAARGGYSGERASPRGGHESYRGRGTAQGEGRGGYRSEGRENHHTDAGVSTRGESRPRGEGRAGFRGGRGGGRGGTNESNRETFGETAVGDDFTRGTGSRRQTERAQQFKTDNEPTHRINVPATDFDFESANSKLNKNDIARQVQNGHDQTTAEQDALIAKLAEIKLAAETVYDKKTSFFDNLSSEHQDRLDRSTQNAEVRNNYRNDDRKLNMETFGVASIYINNGGRGGRGRGRGGRGRGRGGRGKSREQAGQPSNTAQN